MSQRLTGVNEGKFDSADEWIVAKSMPEYTQSFKQLAGDNEKISGSKARDEMVSYWLHQLFIIVP